MKISKLIERLEKIKSKHGDLQIFSIESDCFNKRASIKSTCVEVSKYNDKYAGQRCIELELNGF